MSCIIVILCAQCSAQDFKLSFLEEYPPHWGVPAMLTLQMINFKTMWRRELLLEPIMVD
jgi:hypothetical protein